MNPYMLSQWLTLTTHPFCSFLTFKITPCVLTVNCWFVWHIYMWQLGILFFFIWLLKKNKMVIWYLFCKYFPKLNVHNPFICFATMDTDSLYLFRENLISISEIFIILRYSFPQIFYQVFSSCNRILLSTLSSNAFCWSK